MSSIETTEECKKTYRAELPSGVDIEMIDREGGSCCLSMRRSPRSAAGVFQSITIGEEDIDALEDFLREVPR